MTGSVIRADGRQQPAHLKGPAMANRLSARQREDGALKAKG
jgi:hypothetical protein